jgi:hypothetical protein
MFLACSFWLADAYQMLGRVADAEALFERLLALRNDLGLLPEEYDPDQRCRSEIFPRRFHIFRLSIPHTTSRGPRSRRINDPRRKSRPID